MSVKMRGRTVDVVDLELPAGRLVRVEVERSPDGEPETVTLTEGWSDPPRTDPGRRVQLPGYLLDELREALRTLEEGDA